jgi:hypothetical protein
VEKHDERFENFLREFQPRRPRALPVPLAAKPIWPRRLAAAAVIAVSLCVSLWSLWRDSPPHKDSTAAKTTQALPDAKSAPASLSLLPLTQLAIEDPARLDAVLTEASRHVLRSLQGSESTLRALAKE